MKTIFITGSSSGIGYETAKLFAKNDWKVIATMRNTAKGEELAKLSNVEVVKLDVSNHDEIRRVVSDVLAKYDVDVVLNNAGYGLMAPLEVPTEEQIRKVFETDVFGTLYVNQEFIPHFKKRRKGMIMATTSLAAIIGIPRDGVYGAAKRAQQGMMESLYYELRPFGVAVKTMIPGGTKTNFQTPLNDTTGYEEANARQQEYLRDGNPEFATAEEAAQTIYRAATDDKDQLRYCTDSVCQKLYDQYYEMGYEKFKQWFYEKLFK